MEPVTDALHSKHKNQQPIQESPSNANGAVDMTTDNLIQSENVLLTPKTTVNVLLANPNHQDINLRDYVLKINITYPNGYGVYKVETFFELFQSIRLLIEGQDRRDVNETVMCGKIAEILNGIYRDQTIEDLQTGIFIQTITFDSLACIIPLASMFLFLPRTTEEKIEFEIISNDFADFSSNRVTLLAHMQILSRFDIPYFQKSKINAKSVNGTTLSLAIPKLLWFHYSEHNVNAAIINSEIILKKSPNRMFFFFSNQYQRYSARLKYPTSIILRTPTKKITKQIESDKFFSIANLVDNVKMKTVTVRYYDLSKETIDPGKIWITFHMSRPLTKNSRLTLLFVGDEFSS